MEKVEKPWGYYETLINEGYTKVKRICIKPTRNGNGNCEVIEFDSNHHLQKCEFY